METEELGSVYESLLELQPQLGKDGKTLVFASDISEQRGNQRKTTGSYYTPDSLVQALLDTALGPALDKAEAESEDPEKALLNLTVIDPACGSGHFLLAAARRIATRLARIRTDNMPSEEDFRHAMRDVVGFCVHGVDINPMAVDLTKVALWIETVDSDLPLGFFDAQIRCGNALFGVFDLKELDNGVPDAAYKKLAGDDTRVARYYREKNMREKLERGNIATGFAFTGKRDFMLEFQRFRAMPEDDLSQIEAKAEKLHALTSEGTEAWKLKIACDFYVSSFLIPKTRGGPHARLDGLPRRGAETVPTSGTIWQWLSGVQPSDSLLMDGKSFATSARAFHWPLEFPGIMQRGGFDVVLGNPPWEVMQFSEQEYFAAKHPEIAALAGVERKRAIDALEKENPKAYGEYQLALRASLAANQFARSSGRFDLTARRNINTYALFAELSATLAQKCSGIIVPTGIATDSTTAPFFADLIAKRRLAELADFENKSKLFPAVHSSMKFSLLTMNHDAREPIFAFFLTDPGQLADPDRKFTMSQDEIMRINPNTCTAPVFRTRYDAELTAKIYSKLPVLINENLGEVGNPWALELRQGLFTMTLDSNLFSTAAQLRAKGYIRQGADWIQPPSNSSTVVMDTDQEDNADQKGKDSQLLNGELTVTRFVPLYEGKMISFFDHRFAGYATRGDDRGYRVLPGTQIEEHSDPSFEVDPFYWVPAFELEARLSQWRNKGWLLGWKDITAATNKRTAIFSIIPRVAASDTLPLMFSNISVSKFMGLYANLNSIALDYTARNSVAGLHLSPNYLKQLPILPPSFYTERHLEFITRRVLELTYTSHSLKPLAHDLNYHDSPFSWDEDRRAYLRADLDAFFARAYGLTRNELCYILDPADMKGANYPSETFRVLKKAEIRACGEYRTKHLILKAWDRMEMGGEFKAMGM